VLLSVLICGLQRFRRAIEPSDWTRLLFHAVYVKSFIQTSEWAGAAEVYATLCFSLPTQPLFPNIRHLTWRTTDDIFPYIRILVGDKLRSIVLSMYGSDVIRSSLLPSLTTFHPKLTHVEFDTRVVDSPMIIQAIYSAICGWDHLEKLKFTNLDFPSMLHLARLPNLKYLQLYRFPLDSATVKEFRRSVADSGPVFTALRELTACPKSADDIALFLDAIEPDALDKVVLTLDAPTVTENWQKLNEALARTSSRTLTKLSLKEEFPHDHDIPDSLEGMLTTDSIQPLLSFAELTEVTVVAGHGIDLDDAFLKRLALAWPRLQKLDLSPGCQSARYVPQITLNGLIPLAQYCPKLSSLVLVLNATETNPYTKDKPGGGIANTSLVDLNVVESPISSPSGVASFLSAIFPSLLRVSTRDELFRNPLLHDWDDNIFNWSEVSQLVQVISSARAQEHSVAEVS
jgi:hypothetical protein